MQSISQIVLVQTPDAVNSHMQPIIILYRLRASYSYVSLKSEMIGKVGNLMLAHVCLINDYLLALRSEALNEGKSVNLMKIFKVIKANIFKT